ncbi:hypothetical protein C8R47DRAFT_1214015 [Mycena vitilis]|nr:hypothetical protein C8R47DRAFT_1214015 [Mycena vitilis]
MTPPRGPAAPHPALAPNYTASAAPVIVSLQDFPHWPTWALGDSAQLLVRFGIEGEIIEHYDEKINLWIETNIHYRHTLSADGHIFLRIPDAPCAKFDEIFSSVTAKAIHVRNNLPGDRHSVRQQIRAGKNETIEIDSSDDEKHKRKRRKISKRAPSLSDDDEDAVEIVAEVVAEPALPARADDDDNEFPQTVSIPSGSKTRPTLHIAIPTSVGTQRSSAAPSTTSSATFLSPFAISRSSSPATSAPSSSARPSPSIDLSQNFPAGFYVMEVVAGFRSMRSPDLQDLRIAERFQHVFRRTYKKQTYSDALRRWDIASADHWERGLAAGRTPHGLWTNWQKSVPLKNQI